MSEHTVTDEAPLLTYKGRKFEVNADATGLHTQIKINGVEQKSVKRLVITIEGHGIVKVETTFVDLNKQADIVSDRPSSFVAT